MLLIDRNKDFLPTESSFFQFSVELFPLFISGELTRTDTQVLFFLLQHMREKNHVVLPKYKKITAPDSPFDDISVLSMTPKTLSTSLKKLQDLEIILKIQNGVFMVNPYYISNESKAYKMRTINVYNGYYYGKKAGKELEPKVLKQKDED